MLEWWVLVFVVVVFVVLRKVWHARIGTRLVAFAWQSEAGAKMLSRPAGLLERWYIASHDTGVFYKFGFVLHLQKQYVPDREMLEKVSEQLSRAHPSLRVSIDYQSKAVPHFVMISDDCRRSVVHYMSNRNDDHSWEEVFEEEMNTPFDVLDADCPLWKIVVLHNTSEACGCFEIILLFHHAIADGGSGLMLCKEFLETYAKEKAGSGGFTDEQPLSCWWPPLDEVIDLRPTFGEVVVALTFDKFPWLKPASEYLGPAHRPLVGEEERRGKCVYVSLTSNELRRLHAKCRERKVTIHGALCAAAQLALVSLVEEDTQQSSLITTCSSAISLESHVRHHRSAALTQELEDTSTTTTTIGAYICDTRTRHEIVLKKGGRETFWRIASDVNAGVAASHHGERTIGLLAFIPAGLDAWRAFLQKLRDRPPNGRTTSVSVSNLGRAPGGDWTDRRYHDLQLRKQQDSCIAPLHFAHIKRGEGPLLALSVVTLGDTLSCAISYPSPTIPTATARRYAEAFVGHLQMKDE